MTFFLDCEEPKSPSIPCKFIPSFLKDAFAQSCHVFSVGRRSCSSAEDESPASDIEDQRVIVLAVRSRAMRAKLRRKDKMRSNSFRWVLSPAIGKLFIAPKGGGGEEEEEEEEEEDYNEEKDGNESFFSVKSRFSRSCSNTSGIDYYQYFHRRSVIEGLCLSQCEGWPFGLCRKALMLPPLPRSPSESWSWCGGLPILK